MDGGIAGLAVAQSEALTLNGTHFQYWNLLLKNRYTTVRRVTEQLQLTLTRRRPTEARLYKHLPCKNGQRLPQYCELVRV